MVYFMTMAQFPFCDNLASMGPKTKERENHGVFRSCTKATHDLEEHLQATFSFLFKAYGRAAVGYMIPLHRRSHRGQCYVCKLPFLDLATGRKISVDFLTPSLPLRISFLIMP